MPTSDAIVEEIIALMGRIMGDKPLPEDLQRQATDILASLTQRSTGTGIQSGSPPVLPVAGSVKAIEAGDSSSNTNRRLIYVHGICRHEKGYSDPWWAALHPFEPIAYGEGILGQTRFEVIWSDIVNLAAAMMHAGAVSATLPAASAANEDARSRAAQEIKEALRDRVDQHAMAAASRQGNQLDASVSMGDLANFISIPGFNCVDDFSVYLVDDHVRQEIINRFINVVAPELQKDHELDVISHSWGTVVAYEGLRQLEADPAVAPRIRNLFTVGAALSIAPVKARLRVSNQDGKKPRIVRRWVNLDARGDIVGGPLKNRPFSVDFDFLNLDPVSCGSLFGLVNPVCAHGSYFSDDNAPVNHDIFARFIDEAP